MTEPVITVCMITYNHLNFIRHAIEGVVSQKTNFPIELVIADDCSTDGSREIIREYKERYPEIIKLILQKKNVGVGQNYIDMISTPNSKYIAICDGDDYWTDPFKLQKQVDFLENNPDYAICYHPVEHLYDDPESTRIFDTNQIENQITFTEDLIKNDYITSCSCVMRRDNIKDIPYWFAHVAGMDWAMLLLASFGKKIYRLNDKMAVYRVHNNSIWAKKNYSYKLINELITLGYIEKAAPEIYLQHFKDKIFDMYIELYKANLVEGNTTAALKTIPKIYSMKNHQTMKTYLMATKIVVASFIRRFIKKSK